jgi:hypothetical protein
MSRYIDAERFDVIAYETKGKEEWTGFDDGVSFMLNKIDDAPTADVVPADQLRDITSGLICGACDVFTHGGMTQAECVSCILRHVKKVIGEEVQE